MSDSSDRLLAIARRARWRLQQVRIVRSGAIGLVTGAAVAVGVQIVAMIGRVGVETAWQVGGISMNVGLIVGVLMGFARSINVLEAAAYVDIHRKLKERFLTAVELSLAGRGETPAGKVCVAQALAQAGASPLAGMNIFRPARRPLVVAALMVALVVAGAALAWDLGAGPLAKLSADERTALADVFDESAAAVSAAELNEALARGAVAIRRADDEQLAEILAELRRQGFRPTELTPEAVRATRALLTESSDSGDSADAVTRDPETDEAAGPWTRVYDPDYRPTETAETSEDVSPTFGDYEESWQAAQVRAAAALNRGDIPLAYRQLVRNYFAD